MKTLLKKIEGSNTPTDPSRALCLFIVLQVYFATNILSFGFWKSSEGTFTYMLLFFGAWLAGLTAMLPKSLMLAKGTGISWLPCAVLAGFSVPFAWNLWMNTIDWDENIRDVIVMLLPFLLYLFFTIGLRRTQATVVTIGVLCVAAAVGHSEFTHWIRPSRQYTSVPMENRPNIHLIMIETFPNSAFTKEFMGITNPAADYLASLDNAIDAGTNGFAEFVPTRDAWGTVFHLGNKAINKPYFSGAAPSPLTAQLRANDYTIWTGSRNRYLGRFKGPHVDRYHMASDGILTEDLACETRTGKLGFCSEWSSRLFARIFPADPRAKEWPRAVTELIDRAEHETTKPLFTGFHVSPPIGHTPLTYRHDSASRRKKYKEKFSEGAVQVRNVIADIDRLRRRYPQSIFIVAGDHGPYLSRHMRNLNPRFYVLDRHNVVVSVLNASNLCPQSRTWLESQSYLTPSRAVAGALACEGDSMSLLDNFTDREEFIRLGSSYREH